MVMFMYERGQKKIISLSDWISTLIHNPFYFSYKSIFQTFGQDFPKEDLLDSR